MRRFNILIIMVFLGIAISGCVKERRGLCPCLLQLDFSRLDTSLVTEARVNVAGPEGYVYDESIDALSFPGVWLRWI